MTAAKAIVENFKFAMSYVGDAFLSEIKKGANQAKYILAPYIERLDSFDPLL